MIRLSRTLIFSNGTSESVASEFDKESIIVGRGGDSDLLLEGNKISLRHAKIEHAEDAYWIEDLNSLSGVFVNGRLTKRQVLRKGDEIKIGDHTYVVASIGADLELKEEVHETEKVSTEDLLISEAEALDSRTALPSIRKLSWLALAIVAIGCLLYPLLTGDKRSWSAGPVTPAHKMIEADCAACHEGDFSAVKDTKCETCHNLTLHATVFEDGKHPNLQRPCISCHTEHNGIEALSAGESKVCVTCHGDIKAIDPETKFVNITNFENHPEFSAEDDGTVKLNHQVHLKGEIRGASGLVKLECRDCHTLADNQKTFEPISMVKHCQSCHSLEFDARLAGVVVPHAEPDRIYEFLYSQYAQLLLASSGKVGPDSTTRRRPGAAAPPEVEKGRAFAQSEVETLARAAEKELFTRTGCKLCHKLGEESLAEEDAKPHASHYRVPPANITKVWFTGAEFKHGAHAAVSCESCHSGVRESVSSSDLLLPKLELCQTCHADGARAGKVQSDCADCHSYHDPLPLEPSKMRPLKEIVLR